MRMLCVVPTILFMFTALKHISTGVFARSDTAYNSISLTHSLELQIGNQSPKTLNPIFLEIVQYSRKRSWTPNLIV